MSRRLRILHIGKFAYHRDGGIERHVTTLLRGLAERNFDVTAVVYSDAQEPCRTLIDGVQVCSLPMTSQLASQPIARGLCRTLRQLHREAPFDLVHVHLPDILGHASLLSLCAVRFPPKRVATWHSDIVRQRRAAWLYSAVSPLVLPRWNAVIGSTQAHLQSEQVPRYLGSDRRHVIPYGIDARRFQVTAEIEKTANQIRSTHGDVPLVLAVGRLIPYKGIDVLLRAMANVPAKLVVIGDGPARPSLEQLCVSLGLVARVSFVGRQTEDELKAYCQACDVLCLPSVTRAEAFGFVQAEAMLFEKPVVNTSLGTGVNQVSIDGVTGLTVPPGDPTMLAAALRDLLNAPSRRKTFGEAGRKRVLEHFGCDAMWDETARLYRQLVDE